MLSDFKLAGNWVGKLGAQWNKFKEQNKAEIDALADELMMSPHELAEVYVEPHCQQQNPADQGTDRKGTITVPVFQFLEEFLGGEMTRQDGQRHHFILSDAGMGKTSLMAMLKMGQIRKFWPNDHLCKVFKLGPKTLNAVRALEHQHRTVLLLDGLDEDPTAMGRIEDRLLELLQASRGFRRVIITCRTQFFPRGDGDIFKRPDRVKLGAFTCPVAYLSLFSDEQVLEYLRKRFKPNLFQKIFGKDPEQVTDARTIVNSMDTLRFRPMLLAYIEDFMKAGYSGDNIYEIYQILIQAWLDRETNKENISLKADELLQASKILAREMTVAGVREIYPEARNGDDGLPTLSGLAQKHEVLEKLGQLTLKGRTLLNKNAEGAFRFAHYSIQEFLAVCCLQEGGLGAGFRPTDLMWRFIRDGKLQGLDLREANLEGMVFEGMDLRDWDLRGDKLHGVCLRGVILSGTLASHNLPPDTDLTGACFMSDVLTLYLPGKVALNMVSIPAGTFRMGSPKGEGGRRENERLHQVTISKPFWLGETAVTQAQWWAMMGNNPSDFKGDDLPVQNVSWDDASAFCKKVSKITGLVVALPTEAQWEYACRAGTQTPFHFGEGITTEQVNYNGSYPYGGGPKGEYRGKVLPVKALPTNDWGLYQVHGNVGEWCADCYAEYPDHEVVDPGGPRGGGVVRGGGWVNDAANCRSAYRFRFDPTFRGRFLGFRVAAVQAPS